jgi:ABC-type multidrug transport system fused ATPase/permease subunit
MTDHPSPSHPPAPPSPFQAVRRIVGFLWRRPAWTAAAIGLLLVNIGIELSLPQFVGTTITALGSVTPHLSLGRSVGFFVGLVVLRAAIGLVLGPIRNRTAQTTLGDVRAAVYDSLQRHSFTWHDNARTGELISRAGTDVGRLQDLLFVCLLFGVDVAVGLIGTLSLIFLTSPRLGVMTLVALVPTVVTMAWFAAQLQPRWRKVHERHGAMSTVIQENIAGVRVVKAFARESAEITKFRSRRAEFLKELAEAVNFWAARVPFAQFLFGLAVPLTLWTGGHQVLEGAITLGDLAKVLVYQMALGGRIGVIGQITNILQNSSSAAQRVSELLDDPTSPKPGADHGRTGPIQGTITFEQVGFEYASEPSLRVLDTAKPPAETRPTTTDPSRTRTRALDALSFTVPAGAVVGIVGPTGSGKSTLLALMARFYEPTEGSIRLDGTDLRDWHRDTLRRNLGLVFQETFLFSTTLAENIAFGRPVASREEIEAAARAARADGFIRELPQGYDTVIGERGISLSGGQRQRIAIARALLIQPRLVLLDDATSAVDPTTEQEIREATAELCRGRTTFLVAHRAATVRRADLILVLHDGRLVAQGRHETLLADCPLYRELFTHPEPHPAAH